MTPKSFDGFRGCAVPEAEERLMRAFREFVNLIFSGDVPEFVTLIVFGDTLSTFLKKYLVWR